MKEKVLSIQSRVAYGYVGGNIADLILQMQGIDIISVPTVLLSTHAENKNVRGTSIPQPIFADILEGIGLLDIRSDIRYVISGYFSDKTLQETAYSFIKRQKAETPFTYICDPVMGDFRAGGLYVKKEVAEFYIKKMISLSDIITPNHFELEYILHTKIQTAPQLLELISKSPLLHNKNVVMTSAELSDTDKNIIETIIIRDGQLVRIGTEKIDNDVIGTGDLFTALMTSMLIKGATLEDAVTRTAEFIELVVDYLKKENRREMTAESILHSYQLLQ